MKGYLFLLCFLFLINVVYALEIGVSPPELIFSDSVEESCQEIKIMSEDKRLFNLEDRWNTISNSRSPVFYTGNSDEAGVVVSYERQVVVSDGFKIVKVCLKSVEEGEKHGILIFESNGASLGVRIEVKSEINREIGRLIGITGSAVNNDGDNILFEGNSLVLYLLLFDFILFVVLISLFYMLNRRKT
ncbi:MAG: hypothetical protein Q7R87_01945 [Nanoarchaeota archaeon]|nr:hypothetical protein [Nanoarchaeota archaeon]